MELTLTGLRLHQLRDMIHVTAAFVAQRAGVGLERFADIEAGSVPTLQEASDIFGVLRRIRHKQMLEGAY